MIRYCVLLAVLFVLGESRVEVLRAPFAEIREWEGRIVGGANAAAGQFPYQASLRTVLANQHICGGSIISQNHILSAAHCTISRTAANTNIIVGSHLRLSGGVTHPVAQIHNHPQYDANTIAFDVCVLTLANPIAFNQLTALIPMGSTLAGPGPAMVSGWGQTNHPGTAPNNLQFLSTMVLTNDDCRSRHSAGNAAMVFDHKICTFTQTGQGACMGDSGGPLTANGQVIGIVSWGIACARGFPDVFDRVASHRGFINSVSGL